MKHGITFKRVGRAVHVSIATDLPYNESDECYFSFTHTLANETEAELFLRYLQKRHNNAIEAIREAEFFSGWKHGRAKKHGKAWFDVFETDLSPRPTWPC